MKQSRILAIKLNRCCDCYYHLLDEFTDNEYCKHPEGKDLLEHNTNEFPEWCPLPKITPNFITSMALGKSIGDKNVY